MTYFRWQSKDYKKFFGRLQNKQTKLAISKISKYSYKMIENSFDNQNLW